MEEVVGTQRLRGQEWLLEKEKVMTELNLKRKKEIVERNSTYKGPEAGAYGILGATSSLARLEHRVPRGWVYPPSAAMRLERDDRYDHAFMFLLREQAISLLPAGQLPSSLVLNCQFP